MSTTFFANPKKCRHCKTLFTPIIPMQIVCGIECAKAIARKKREKVEKANDRQKREQLKTRSQWMKEAQIAFNAFIRDRDKNGFCITCGKLLESEATSGGSFDCGHYRSVGSSPNHRFNEDNAHGQCKQCNRWGSGRAVDYRIALIKKIGQARVELLESDQTVKKWTIDDLKSIKATYVQKLKELREKEAA